MAGVVTYLNVGSGQTPPTQAQASQVNSVIVNVAPNTNTPANTVITHNLQLPASDITQQQPQVDITPLDALAGTSGWYLQSMDPNFIGLAQVNTSQGVDSAAQIRVKISRPNTIIR